jgi:hypothetical protein
MSEREPSQEAKVSEIKKEMGGTKVSKAKVRARIEELRAGRRTGADVDVFALALGPTEECLSPRQILRAMVLGITGKEREHVLGCLPCLDHLRRSSMLNLFEGNYLSKREVTGGSAGEVVVMHQLEAARGRVAAAMKRSCFQGIMATMTRVQKIGLPAIASQEIEVDFVPLFDLEPYQLDRFSFALRGGIKASTVGRFEKIDINRDGKCDYIKIVFTDIQPSKPVAAAVSAKRTILDTVQLVGCLKDAQQKKYDLLAQANLEFKGV